MELTRTEKAFAVSEGVRSYLRGRYGDGRDLSWHPLFCAARDLFIYLIDGN